MTHGLPRTGKLPDIDPIEAANLSHEDRHYVKEFAKHRQIDENLWHASLRDIEIDIIGNQLEEARRWGCRQRDMGHDSRYDSRRGRMR